MGSILAAFGAWFVQLVGNVGLRALALKFFFRGMLVVLIPISVLLAMDYFLVSVVQFMVTQLNTATSSVPSSLPGFQLGIIGAYLFQQMGLGPAISFIISAALIKMTIRSIPFLHL